MALVIQTLKEAAVYFDQHNALRPRTKSVVGQVLSSSPSSGQLDSMSAVPLIPDITVTDRSTYALCQWTKSLPR
jgi:hypothetical protein